MKASIRTAVFPVAGRGTRFLPATKASPKEMLPVVDKPLIQYAVEEALEAGARRLVFITGASKRAIEDHFDSDQELEKLLVSQGKNELVKQLRSVLPKYASCIYIRQPEALGLGHAVLCARPAIGNEPFAVLLADDLIDSQPGALQHMVAHHQATGASVLGVETVAREETGNYGIVEVREEAGCQRVVSMVEKPKPEAAPSTLAVVGRYILPGSIFDKLLEVRPGAGGEIQLTDGIAALLKEHPVHALPLPGTRYDCGSKLGYLKASVDYALKHHEVGTAFAHWLRAHPAR